MKVTTPATDVTNVDASAAGATSFGGCPAPIRTGARIEPPPPPPNPTSPPPPPPPRGHDECKAPGVGSHPPPDDRPADDPGRVPGEKQEGKPAAGLSLPPVAVQR